MYNVCKTYAGLQSYKGVECRAIADIYYEAVKEFGKRELDIEKRLEGLKIREEDLGEGVISGGIGG